MRARQVILGRGRAVGGGSLPAGADGRGRRRPSGTASTALTANSTAYRPVVGEAGRQRPRPGTLPTNSDPAKNETTVARATAAPRSPRSAATSASTTRPARAGPRPRRRPARPARTPASVHAAGGGRGAADADQPRRRATRWRERGRRAGRTRRPRRRTRRWPGRRPSSTAPACSIAGGSRVSVPSSTAPSANAQQQHEAASTGERPTSRDGRQRATRAAARGRLGQRGAAARRARRAAAPVSDEHQPPGEHVGHDPGADRGERGAERDADHQPRDVALPHVGPHGVAEVDQGGGVRRAEQAAGEPA